MWCEFVRSGSCGLVRVAWFVWGRVSDPSGRVLRGNSHVGPAPASGKSRVGRLLSPAILVWGRAPSPVQAERSSATPLSALSAMCPLC